MTLTATATITMGRWAEMDADAPLAATLRHRLTIANPEYAAAEKMGFATKNIAETITLYEDTLNGILRVPRAVVVGLRASSFYTFDDQMTEGAAAPMKFLGKLRPYQVPFVDALEHKLRTTTGTVGQAPAGSGKTLCSLALAARLGRRTLIIVHKEFLMTQWVERILGTKAAAIRLGVPLGSLSAEAQPAFLDIRPEELGIVQQDVCEWKDRKIVIAMAQSLLAREYGEDFESAFGTILTDEVHRFAAPSFAQTITMFPARYRLGVTATPTRKDGMEQVFYSHIGPIGAVGETAGAKPRVSMVKTPVVVPPAVMKTMMSRGREDLVKITTYLVRHEARNRFIVDMLVKALQNDRKVLVLSSRLEHLDTLRELLLTVCKKTPGMFVSTAYYVGGMSMEERKEAEKMQCLFATQAMAEEGLDIPALDTLFLVTPKGTVNQACGRILRTVDDKKTPVVVDFMDTQFAMTRGLAAKREREYRSLGWINGDKK